METYPAKQLVCLARWKIHTTDYILGPVVHTKWGFEKAWNWTIKAALMKEYDLKQVLYKSFAQAWMVILRTKYRLSGDRFYWTSKTSEVNITQVIWIYVIS